MLAVSRSLMSAEPESSRTTDHGAARPVARIVGVPTGVTAPGDGVAVMLDGGKGSPGGAVPSTLHPANTNAAMTVVDNARNPLRMLPSFRSLCDEWG